MTLTYSIAQPVEAHVHGFGSFLFDGVVGDPGGALVVELEGRGSLRVAEFFEGLTERDDVFCSEVACSCFCLLCGGHYCVDEFAHDVDGVVVWWRRGVGCDWEAWLVAEEEKGASS